MNLTAKLVAGAFGVVGMAGAAFAQDVKLGVVAVNYNSPSIQRQADSGIAYAKELGWEVELFDGQGDQVATNNAAMAFMDRDFDAILKIHNVDGKYLVIEEMQQILNDLMVRSFQTR